jgi:hypothetical protein
MGATTPSLSEFTHIPAEPTVNPGVILDSRDAVHELNQSAQFNADMKQKRYAQQLAALKDIYQDVGTIAAMPVMPQDRPLLQKKMADILNTIGNDPHAALGGPKFGEIQRGLGELRSLSTQSKQDLVYSEAHDKIMESDPSLATPENKTKASTFDNTPLGSRQKFLFDTPVKFDPEAAMGKILQQKQVAVPFANQSFEGPHSEWIVKETGTRYDRNSALGMWNQGYETGTDENNQPIKKWAFEQFNRIKNDPTQLAKFGNPKDPQEFYQNLGKMMYGADKDIVGEKTSTRVANPYTMLTDRDNFALYKQAISERNAEKLAAVKKNLELKGAPENANFLVKQYANVLGNTTGERKPVEIGGGRIENEEVVDVPATILKNYAEGEKATVKEGQSFSPVVETILKGNAPDLTTRTSDGNLRLSIYKRYDEAHPRPPGKKPGDVVLDANGIPVVDKFSVIPRRNLLTTLGKGVVQTKLLSYSIDVADQALKNQPNDVLDKINTSDDDETVIAQANEAKKPTKKTYTVGGKTLTMDQIEKGAKKYKMSVQDYMKNLGIQ